jgi:mono/diheme cytochrome c family protein
VSTDDSKVVAQTTIAALLDIMEEEDPEDQAEQIAEIEEEFFNHCLVCHDRLAFIMVWWEMSKNKWDFNDKWLETKEYFAKQAA